MIRTALTFSAGVLAGGYLAAWLTLARTATACPALADTCLARVLP